jgi:acyl carrier protein
MSEAIAQRVVEAIAESRRVDAGQISLDTTFEELGMTSLDALSLVYDLEEEFNVSIPNEEVMSLRSVGQAVESVRRLLSETEAMEGEAAGL